MKFLLKLGAPAGVYDTNGCSAVQMMVETMPQMAYQSLNQFCVDENTMRRRHYYLDQLEYGKNSRSGCKHARSVLEVSVNLLSIISLCLFMTHHCTLWLTVQSNKMNYYHFCVKQG